MGFYTNVTISNDFWHQVAKDPQALVDYIGWAMNDGTNSPIGEAFAERQDRVRHEVRYGGPQGVVVHKAQHADTPQVIINTYGSRAVAAHEIPYAIRNGWLDGGKYRAKQAELAAKELEDLAAEIRTELKEAERRAGHQGS